MKEFRFIGKTIGILLFSSMMLSSCSDTDEYYDAPDWIGGSIYQTLQDEGNYSVFLKGVDIAGYQPIMDGKSIMTVMAPDDNAMTTYLQQNYGTSDITQVSADEVKKLIGFHILYYSFDKNKLTNFRPLEGDGASEEELNLNAGMYYKFRTRSQDSYTKAFDKTRNREVTVYHNERMLPVFSYRMFQTKNINAKNAYEYFYPETGWRGDGGFNVANAAVNQYEQIGRNGYIYKVDRVLKPLETIYDELDKSGKYTRILSLYNNSEYFEYDSIAHRELQTSDSLFHHYHKSPLVNIDSEWGSVFDYMNVSALSSQAYTMFAPTDEAFQKFFDEYWGEGGYTSIEEIDSVTMQEIMKSCLYPTTIVFPEEVAKGNLVNPITNEVVSVNLGDVSPENRIICSNGALYGCNVLTPPVKFRAVSGPGFQYKDFSYFNEMVNNSGMSNTLVADAVKFIMLYPDTIQMYNAFGIERVGGKLVSTASPNGINGGNMTAYVNAHVVSPIDGNSVLPETGIHVLPTLTTDFKLYWYLKDGKITNSILNNYRLKFAANTVTDDQIWATVEPLAYRGDVNGWTNGHAYRYSNTGDPATNNILFPGRYDQVKVAGMEKLVRLMVNNRQDTSTEFFGWINLLNKANLINTSGGLVTFMIDNCLMLIPTTQAIEQAIKDNKVPGVSATDAAVVGDPAFFDNITIDDAVAFTEYAKLYFVPLTTATFNNYPYLGWGENTAKGGGLITYQQEISFNPETFTTEIISTNMNIYDDGNALYATIIDRETGVEGNRVKFSGVYDYLPFVFEDGPAHFIEGVFEVK